MYRFWQLIVCGGISPKRVPLACPAGKSAKLSASGKKNTGRRPAYPDFRVIYPMAHRAAGHSLIDGFGLRHKRQNMTEMRLK